MKPLSVSQLLGGQTNTRGDEVLIADDISDIV
jgi:hypothetical protein